MEHWEVISLLLMVYDFLAIFVSYFAALWIRFDCRFSRIEPEYLHAFSHSILFYGAFCIFVFWAMRLFVSYFAALWIRFDCRFSRIEPEYLHAFSHSILFYGAFCIFVFWAMRLYKSIWRFASYAELLRMILATLITGTVHVVCVSLFVGRMPVIYYSFGILIQFCLTLGVRFSYRFVLLMLITGTVHVVCVSLFVGRMPVIYYSFGILIQFCLTLGVRFSYRFVLLMRGKKKEHGYEKRVMLIGAGAAGQMIFRDIRSAVETNERVYCFIDDNQNKWGRYIDNVPVFGGRESIMEAVAKFGIEKIYVAIPSAAPEDKRDILRICSETSCELMNLPGMYQLYTGEVAISKMKPVQIEDLLGRDPIRPDMKEVYEYIEGKVVLITGVGSIGSELARQIASHHPKHLILFDIYENNAYDIQLELKKKYPNLKLDTIIGSVRDSRKIFDLFEQYRPEIVYHAAAHKHVQLELKKKYPNLKLDTIIGSVRDSRKIFDLFEQYRPEIVYHAAAHKHVPLMEDSSRKIFDLFEQYRPEIVYHAAAHKHVPLMEDSPCEAVKNNAMGTYKTAYAAMAHGCKRFVLISTDKAVNPTNIMGASKRLCEMIIQAFDAKIKEGKAGEIPQLFTHGMSEVITDANVSC